MKGSVYCGKDPIRAKIQVMDKEIVVDDVVASFTTNVDPDNVVNKTILLIIIPYFRRFIPLRCVWNLLVSILRQLIVNLAEEITT